MMFQQAPDAQQRRSVFEAVTGARERLVQLRRLLLAMQAVRRGDPDALPLDDPVPVAPR